MKWTFFPIKQLAALAPTWDALNGATGELPFLHSRFMLPLCEAFGDASLKIALCENAQGPVAMGVLARRGLASWESFQPSQSPLGAWVMRPDQDFERDLVADRPERDAIERAAAHEQETAERILHAAELLVKESAGDHPEGPRDEAAPLLIPVSMSRPALVPKIFPSGNAVIKTCNSGTIHQDKCVWNRQHSFQAALLLSPGTTNGAIAS